MDLKLTDYDLDLAKGDLSFVTGIEAVRQDLEMSLRTWLAETPYDRSAGVPYLQIIFRRGTTIEAIRFIIERHIAGIDGVDGVLELDTAVDKDARVMRITGRVRALDQEFPIDLEITQ